MDGTKRQCREYLLLIPFFTLNIVDKNRNWQKNHKDRKQQIFTSTKTCNSRSLSRNQNAIPYYQSLNAPDMTKETKTTTVKASDKPDGFVSSARPLGPGISSSVTVVSGHALWHLSGSERGSVEGDGVNRLVISCTRNLSIKEGGDHRLVRENKRGYIYV